MPALSFSGEPKRGPFWKLILDHKKTQTAREPRRYPIRKGNWLFLYWKQRTPKRLKPIHFIGTAKCIGVEMRTYGSFKLDDGFAWADGFEDHLELMSFFEATPDDLEFDVIHFTLG